MTPGVEIKDRFAGMSYGSGYSADEVMPQENSRGPKRIGFFREEPPSR